MPVIIGCNSSQVMFLRTRRVAYSENEMQTILPTESTYFQANALPFSPVDHLSVDETLAAPPLKAPRFELPTTGVMSPPTSCVFSAKKQHVVSPLLAYLNLWALARRPPHGGGAGRAKPFGCSVDGGKKRRRGDHVAGVKNGGAQPCRPRKGGVSDVQECIATWRFEARNAVRC